MLSSTNGKSYELYEHTMNEEWIWLDVLDAAERFPNLLKNGIMPLFM